MATEDEFEEIGSNDDLDLDDEEEIDLGGEEIDLDELNVDEDDEDDEAEDEDVDDEDVEVAEDDEEELAEDDELEDEESEESLEVLLGTETDDEDEGEARTRGAAKADTPIGEGEFTCRSCFLVKRRAQLADAKRQICLDCA